MAKSKILSWLGFGKKEQEQQSELEKKEIAAQVEKERLEAEAAEKAEQERLAAEAAEKAEQERLAAEAAEKAEQARLAAEAAEKAEQERLAAEAAEKAEQARLALEAAEKAEQERLAVEAAERAEQERLAAEAAEKAEQARLAAEAAEKAEQERLALEAAEKAEQERLALEAAEKAEQERLAAEAAEKAEQARLALEAAEKAEQERLAVEAAERAEQERLAAEAAEKAEQERLALEAAEKAEQERLAVEAAEKAEQERLAAEAAEKAKQEKPKKEKVGFFKRLKQGLIKTKQNIGSGFAGIFSGKKIDDDLFEELETQLLTADVGVDTTVKLIDKLTDMADRKQLKDGEALYELLKGEMAEMLKAAEKPLEMEKSDGPFVILMVGVNGVGKTTTIGKLAKQYQNQGKSVMLAAGDTFRAAAVEQLQVWGERNDIPVIAQHTGADSASVVFDALQAAKARNVDVLIADTAGRLQNKDHLMQELEKIARVMKKLDVDAPHEVMLTIDAGTGQNAISQVKLFDQAVGLTGISLTKLDGTAKGGVIFAVADKFNIPIRYIGVGEGIDDLREFNSDDFINALFSE